MKKPVLVIFLFWLFTIPAYAGHIAGGEIFYRYIGPGAAANSDKYTITLRLFRECNPGGNAAAMPGSVTLGVYSGSALFKSFPVSRTRFETISVTPSAYPCISPPPNVCYQVGYFEISTDLPRQANGYIVSFQTCCRTNGIVNMQSSPIAGTGFVGDGATYACFIPGTTALGPGAVNSSPEFLVKDTAIVCADNLFRLDFGATDADGDSLSYSFCSAYNRGSSTSADGNHIPSLPPYQPINYTSNFSGNSPIGVNTSINSKTGLITGIAPASGRYVINVCIDEWRRGVKISEHRKDFTLRVESCNIAGASLQPDYLTCDGYTLTFQNLSNSPLVNSWYWDFGFNGPNNISVLEKPTVTFPDTGQYTVKLVVNRGQRCSDSITTTARIYPGFFPDLKADGSCRFTPFFFKDNSTTRYGTISKWLWQFGDETTTRDSSLAREPQWQYATTGFKKVTLTVESSKGCVGTAVLDSLEVKDKPTISLPFRDTLICSIDTLQLSASGGGNFSWQPTTFAINTNTANPLVFPKTTTVYKVTINDNGCVNTDSLRVRVVDFVSLDAGADTTICLTDRLSLNPNSNGLRYSWTPAATLLNPNTKRPVAIPPATTTYQVLASIGKCNATDNITVRTVPYPVANAGRDTVICYEDTAQLKGAITGASFTWSPASTLLNASSLTPLAFPLKTTPYVLTVRDNLGCPKPKLDTVVVTVRPKILADAGRDTSVVTGQPLQLSASGAELFEWSPPQGLNNTNVSSPITTLRDNITYYIKVFNEVGCFSYDTLNVKVFRTQPDIFVPNAFTPASTTNNRFHPIPVGVSTIDFFRVYNRWGQLVFSSNDSRRGWDGSLGGKPQDAGTYVWMVQGKDYTGKTIAKKGTMVLIR